MKLLLTLLFASFSLWSLGQACSALGQNPSTAFPVCGTTSFQQNIVPICTNGDLPTPGCSGLAAKNPFWYKFTCYASGTLSFTITPINQNDDYDWQLYDITGRNPNEVFTNTSLIVTGNWAGTYGNTGASASGVSFIQCGSVPAENKPKFAKSPDLIVGRTYLLMISHFDDTQTGYGLNFNGGTAVITDPKLPAFATADAACDGTKITVKLNKDMKCNSLAANGSDFAVSVPGVGVIAANSSSCSSSFDFNELTITTSSPLPPGTYDVIMQTGSDGNTILDNCDRPIAAGSKISFTVFPQIPTPFDSITKVKCAPRTLELVFRKNMMCSSVAADGSDFVVTGPSVVTVASAAGVSCINGLSKKINVQLSAPLQVGGIYTISLRTGNDGNTLLDECAQATPASSLNFAVADTVNADFSFLINYGCAFNLVNYAHNGANNVNIWQWNFKGNGISSLQNPATIYQKFLPTTTTLIVTNGVCTDSSSQNIIFDNYLKASFEVTPVICPQTPAVFTNNSEGRIVSYSWNFGNGNTSIMKTPIPQNYIPRASTDFIALPQLIVQNDYGCYDTITKPVKVAFSCFITVPSAFTPNGDGRNDYLYPLQAFKAVNLIFRVYDRWGNLVFQGKDFTQKWNGRYKGQEAAAGTYVWMLSYKDVDTGKDFSQKGTSILIR